MTTYVRDLFDRFGVDQTDIVKLIARGVRWSIDLWDFTAKRSFSCLKSWKVSSCSQSQPKQVSSRSKKNFRIYSL